MFSSKSSRIRAKVVVIGQRWLCSVKNWCIPEKWFYLVKRGCDRVKVVLIGQKLLYSGKSGSIRAKGVFYFARSIFFRAKLLVFLAKVVLFGQMWLYSGTSGYIRAKVVLFGQKWL